MASSPSRQDLYRRITAAVILGGLAFALVQVVDAQFARRPIRSEGPRALGLLRLPGNGQGNLIPICIMVDGKFYDAGIYKADPVPMALEQGTVYEADATGKPLGLFTVTGASQGNGTWWGTGFWLATGATPQSDRRKAETAPRMAPEDKPPVLRRPGSEASKTESKPGEAKPDETKPPDTKPPDTKLPESKPSAPEQAPASTSPAPNLTPKPSTEAEGSRPVLRRGKPEPPKMTEKKATADVSAKSPASKPPSAKTSASAKGEIQVVPAISDAGGPDPRPYTFAMKPEEEQAFRKKMLALAKDEVLKRVKQAESGLVAPPPGASRKTKAIQPPQPEFADVQQTVFDLSTSNEPVLVLSARAHLPERPTKAGESSLPRPDYYVTLVARADLYNELKIVLSAVTDEQHLDVTPRLQLIDAVDADGDGRGELLFRKISDAGTAYGVYRVTADQLWPLFEGAVVGSSSQ